MTAAPVKASEYVLGRSGAGTDFLSVFGWLGWGRRFWVWLVEFMAIWGNLAFLERNLPWEWTPETRWKNRCSHRKHGRSLTSW